MYEDQKNKNKNKNKHKNWLYSIDHHYWIMIGYDTKNHFFFLPTKGEYHISPLSVCLSGFCLKL